MTPRLLLFADRADWVRVAADGRVGTGRRPAPPLGEPEIVILAVPGEQVAMHWIELPELAPAQARAAARLAVSDLAATAIDDAHVAVGRRTEEGYHPVALVDTARLAGWLADAQAESIDPDRIVPEPLLIDPPAAGERHLGRDGLVLVRGPAAAMAIEPELAAALAEPGTPVEQLDERAFLAGLPETLAAIPVDLRQGSFAKRRRLRIDWPQVRRIAVTAAALLLVTLAIQLALITRYDRAAAAAEAEAQAIADRVAPGGGDPLARLTARLAAAQGGGLGYDASAAAVFAAIRDTGGVELGGLSFDGSGTLVASILAPGPSEIGAVASRLQTAGFEVTTGAARGSGGRQVADLTVRAR